MHTRCYFAALDDTATDDDFIVKATNYGTALRDSFDADLAKNLRVGGVVLLETEQLVVVGGRRSIAQSFGHIPVQGYDFRAPVGQILYFTATQSAPTRDRSLKAGFDKTVQIATGRSFNAGTAAATGANWGTLMANTYNPNIIKKTYATTALGVKKRTVIRIFPAHANFNGMALGPSATGAVICLKLRQHFGF